MEISPPSPQTTLYSPVVLSCVLLQPVAEGAALAVDRGAVRVHAALALGVEARVQQRRLYGVGDLVGLAHVGDRYGADLDQAGALPPVLAQVGRNFDVARVAADVADGGGAVVVLGIGGLPACVSSFQSSPA